MLRVGLTGGIASGKSLVGSMLEAYGAYLLDTDQVAREVVEPGQPALEALIETFGDSILAADGSLDRRRMRDLVFADADLRSRLEALLHPAIRARTLELINAAAADSQPYTVVMVPLLVETSFAELVDRVLLVEAEDRLKDINDEFSRGVVIIVQQNPVEPRTLELFVRLDLGDRAGIVLEPLGHTRS